MAKTEAQFLQKPFILDKCMPLKKKLKFSMIDFRDIPIYLFWSPVDKPDESDFFLVYNFNIPSIWTFMHHPCFPTKKVSKAAFFLFQQLYLVAIFQLREEKCHF